MSPTFNSARLSVEVGGLDLSVLALAGQEGLSQPFCYHLDILAAPAISCAQLLDLPARILVTGSDGGCRTICGVVTSVEEKDPHHDGRRCLSLTVESSLARLRLQYDTRLFLHQSIPQILRSVLESHGIADERLRLHLIRHYPVRPWTLQVNESDFDFIARMLAGAGIFSWSEADADGELICFSDHNAQLPERSGGHLPYRPDGGLEPQSCGIRALQVRRRMVADLFEVQEKSRRQPSRSLHAQASSGGAGRLRRYRYAAGVEDLNEAEQIARTEAQQAAAYSFELQAQTDLADLSAGQVVSLDAGGLPSQYSGDYLIRALSLRLSQRAGTQAAGDDLALSCEATLIPRMTPFRPPWLPRPRIPFTFSARIEGSGAYAPLDEHGRIPVRAHFDQSTAAHGEASIPLPRLAPHGGHPANQACGLHTPLHEGSEVLLSCLNGDPDRPVLVGALPNPATPGPVTVANPAQNILRTAADNQLLMDDRREHEVIGLCTFAGNNILELNATALGHRIALASHQGALQIQAQKTQHIQCGDTLTEQCGNDRSHRVETRHATQTRSAEIHHQAASDHQHRGAANLHLESARNTEMTSAQSLRLDVARGQKLTVRGPEATFSVLNGAVHIQAAKDIDIQG
ncbi:MAG TPA: type VI secretion system tip protein VgrG, partial [Geoalkalibacter subterraneus]|nr:type VI secretion system tip protein VgrG [Geoalkalibacter subterraneus]